MKTETYTGATRGYVSDFFDKEQFMGLNCEKFHDAVTRYANNAVDAVCRGCTATKEFVAKRWYMVAVPIAFTFAAGMGGILMALKPDVEVKEVLQNRRKKTYWDYGVKYYDQGQQKVKETTDQAPSSLEQKVDREEAKK